MIARLWQATTRSLDLDAYWAFLQRRILPDHQAAPGSEGVQLFRRLANERAHFLALSYWSSLQAARAFGGGSLEAARYYPENSDYLVDPPLDVIHFETEVASLPHDPTGALCTRCASAHRVPAIAAD